MVKARLLYAAAAVIVIALGLGSRKLTDFLPLFVSSNAGDALWASMIYLVFRAVWISYSRGWAAGVGLIFCCAIECSQLYQAEWINSIRSTLLGALVLGKGFLFIDLVRYTVGIAIPFIADSWIQRQSGT